MSNESTPEEVRVVATNRRARHDYQILSVLEAGIELTGSEVKSLRNGTVTIREAYAAADGEEIFVYHLHIPVYDKAGSFTPDPDRARRLLLHRRQIRRLIGQTQQRGLTLVPLRLYFRGPWAKLELGLARGKSAYDKRRSLADREAEMELARAMRRNRR
jgi:SsrA-binding protein